MNLANLIRKGGLAQFATATRATLATQVPKPTSTVAKVATVAVTRPPPPTLTATEERSIRAWLAHIEESDQTIIAEVVALTCINIQARNQLLQLAEAMPSRVTPGHGVRCCDCHYFMRIDHPHLGHCASGEPEDIVGLWDTDSRRCEIYFQSASTLTNKLFAKRQQQGIEEDFFPK